MIKWGLFQECKVSLTSKYQAIKLTYWKTEKRNHVDTEYMSMDTEKAFGKINTHS